MRTMTRWLLVLGCCALGSGLLAAPTFTTEKIPLKDLKMSSEDLLQNKPFELDSADTYFFWRGQYNPEPFGLTDAKDGAGPLDDIMAGSPAETIFRWDLGTPSAQGRALEEIHVYWGMADSARNGVNLKFAVHDPVTLQWRDITDYIKIDAERVQTEVVRVLKITFPAGEVTNFDALRMYDGRPLLKVNTTRFIEVDVFSTPKNR